MFERLKDPRKRPRAALRWRRQCEREDVHLEALSGTFNLAWPWIVRGDLLVGFVASSAAITTPMVALCSPRSRPRCCAPTAARAASLDRVCAQRTSTVFT